MAVSLANQRLIEESGRRQFLQQSLGLAASAVVLPQLSAQATEPQQAETLVKVLYDTLTEPQRQQICYAWDHVDPKRGLLRTRVSNNWMINDAMIHGDFYTAEQRDLIRKIFENIVSPEWISKFDQQMEDDCGGFGREQAIGIFGTPQAGPFQFVITGRHMTLRCDGNTAESVAFGGPIFYGHDPGAFDEGKDHAGNVFWQQAVQVNQIYQMLDGKQRRAAEVATTPREQAVAFRGKAGGFTGIPVTDLSSDQQQELRRSLTSLLDPFRQTDRQEALQCLQAQGGLEGCFLSFYTDHDIGQDRVWDNWRLEGPSFVWHFRGAPHVHVWVNIADSPKIELNA
ncbi:MAG: DUF3500 domain-containing protein [Pirellulaceae bacterium]|nr:DUF3500 domain-containing protein [Pirellulaceae bacterium]